ncbi:MAG: ATP-binding protein [Pseudomonadota bacterium]
MLQRLTLTHRIALAAALLTLLTVALIGGVAFMLLRAQVMETMQLSLEHRAEDAAKVMESRFDALDDTLTTLAGNTLVANALADNEGRKRYLSAFLGSYQTIAGVSVQLTLTDFMGRPLSHPAALRVESGWVAELVEQNRTGAALIDTGEEGWLVLARPVIYANTGLPEGALVLQVRSNQLMHLPPRVSHSEDWRDSAHFALYLGETLPQQSTRYAGLPEPDKGIGLRYPLQLPSGLAPLKAELEVATDPYRFNAPLRQLIYYATGLSLLVLLLVAGLSIALGHVLTGRLRQLQTVAHQVTLAPIRHQRLSIPGGDEVTSLAQSFNRLLDDLQQAFDKLQQNSDSLEHALADAHRARNEAEQANRAKSLFLANMSHELRTPLNAILGFAQLLERDPAMAPEQRQTLQTIYRSGQHLLSLINDVLEISRIEAGRMELAEAPFDLHELLAAVTDVLRLRAEEKGLTLELRVAPEVPGYIEGDQRKLRQILINLLGNAIKFTDDGWVRLSVGLESGRLRIDIADSGQGIGENERRHIFEPFQQGPGDHRHEGTGLGLSISKEFVEVMGGRIQVTSTPGRGTTFTVHLPYRAADATPLRRGYGQQHVIALQPGQPEYRVLVVDDKPEGRQLLASILDSVGFNVRCVDNGAEALRSFHQWQPHVIWMDMRMPVMDGYEATRRIKATPEGEKTVIIALTASAFEEDRDAVLEAGSDHFMRKPIDTDEVFEVMGRFLGVAYRYGHSENPHSHANGENGDLSAALKALPATLRQRLGRAAAALDVAASREAIAAIAEYNEPLAQRLTTLTKEYRYDQLARLCGQEEDDHAK